MGIQERKERERANMRRLILETANSLFISKGFDNISIRNIAKLIEYSPATIYLYFKNKEEIIFSLRNTFIEDLLEQLEEFNFIKDHISRLKNLANSWFDFAINNPEKYELIFIKNGKLKNDTIYIYLQDIMSNCMNENLLNRMPIQEATTMIISYLHGLSQLALRDKLDISTKSELKDFAGNLINRYLGSMKGAAAI